MQPASDVDRHDCWAVCFGHAHNVSDRCVAAGYANGDVKLFDLRANALRWEGSVGHGVCALQVRVVSTAKTHHTYFCNRHSLTGQPLQ